RSITTLFRSYKHHDVDAALHALPTRRSSDLDQKLHDNGFSIRELYPELFRTTAAPKTENKQSVTPKYRNPDNPDETWTGRGRVRSEEHTSELQSRENLVCRLVLEKKKKN